MLKQVLTSNRRHGWSWSVRGSVVGEQVSLSFQVSSESVHRWRSTNGECRHRGANPVSCRNYWDNRGFSVRLADMIQCIVADLEVNGCRVLFSRLPCSAAYLV